MHTHTVPHRAGLAWLHAWRNNRHLNCLKCGQELWLHDNFPGICIMLQLHETAIRDNQKSQRDRMTPALCFLSRDPINHKPNSENCAIKGNLHPLFWNIWDVLNDFGDDVLVDALVFVVGFRWLCAMQKSQRDSVTVVFNRRRILTASNIIPLYCHQKKKKRARASFLTHHFLAL